MVYQISHWFELRLLNQVKLFHKVDEVFEGVVQMSIGITIHHGLEVRVEDVCVNTEKALVDDLDPLLEVRQERLPGLYRQEGLICKLGFYPNQQLLHILWRRERLRGLDFVTIGPLPAKAPC